MTHSENQALLQVKDLVKYYPIRGGLFFREIARVHAVDGISFEIKPGQTLGLVGESGCGKSTVGRTLIKLHEANSGQIIFDGHDITHLSRKDFRPHRENIQFIFQDPYESLNPRHTVRQVLEEPYLIHCNYSKKERIKRIEELLELVGLPKTAIHKYAHEFSGGQRQRIGIARALALKPKLIICDEPVSALDVSVQAQVMNLMVDLQKEFNLSYLFIAHDLSVVKHLCDEIAVMYLGKIVEKGPAEELFNSPKHPYTKALISAVCHVGDESNKERIILEGEVPSPISPPSGCRFHTRCPYTEAKCRNQVPEVQLDGDTLVACHFHKEI